MTDDAPSLQTLLLLLRNAGVPVGVEEIGRLAAVFEREPALGDDGLRHVLESVLVKSVEQRAVFARVYRHWLEVVDQGLRAREAEHEEEAAGERARRSAHRLPRAANKAAAFAAAAPANVLAASVSSFDEEAPAVEDAEPEQARSGRDIEEREARQGKVKGRPKRDIKDLEARMGTMRDHALSEPVPMVQAAAGPDIGGPIRFEGQPVMQAQVSPASAHARPRQLLWQLGAVAALVGAVVISVRALGHHDSQVQRNELSSPSEAAVSYTAEVEEFLRRMLQGIAPRAAKVTAPVTRDHMAELMASSGMLMVDEPRLEVQPVPEPPGPGWLPYGLIAVSLLLAMTLKRMFGVGRWLPRPGRPRSPPPGPPVAGVGPRLARAGDALILDERDEEDLVWGVGRFVSDEQGRDLDMERTVGETAAAFGRPVLCFQSARYQREVWLWIDESLDSPVARHLASDLAVTLERAGLPVARATFWGIPDVLTLGTGERVTVDALDAQRDGAAVAILTDGRLIAHAHRARERRADLHTLLRNLSFWPRVTFIDFGDGALGAIAERHGLLVIQPDDAPMAISDVAQEIADAERAQATGLLAGDARVWAAACALTPRPVSDRVALALRRKLGLRVSPWIIELLRQSAERDAGGLTWSVAHRATLLAWLVDAEELPLRQGKLPHHSLLSRVVAAWERILDEREREQRRVAEQRGERWDGSMDAREIEIERAFVRLWDRPARAVAALYDLFRAGHAPAIRRVMADLAPREAEAREGVIVLPWLLSRQRRETQVMLAEMGFAARAAMGEVPRSMPRPGRMWLALGLCAGLAVGATAGLIAHALKRHEPPAVLDARDVPAKTHARMDPAQQPDGTWRAEAWSLWAPEGASVSAGVAERVVVRWTVGMRPCEDKREGVEILRCTSQKRPPAASTERWSVAVISMVQGEELAREVARELLDSGSVDGVFLVGEDIPWRALPLERMARSGPAGASDQLLLVLPAPVLQYQGKHVSVPWSEVEENSDATEQVSALWSRLRDYPGKHVLLSVDDLGRLRGILDFAHGQEATLAERLAAVGQVIQDMRGDPAGFIVRGLGECGNVGQPCCNANSTVSALCNDDLVCDDGECEAIVCDPGVVRCSAEGDAILTCNELGTGDAVERCDPGEVCTQERCVAVTTALVLIKDVIVPERSDIKLAGLRCTVNGRESVTISFGAQRAYSRELMVKLDRERTLRMVCALVTEWNPAQSTFEHALGAASGEHRGVIALRRGDKRPEVKVEILYGIQLGIAVQQRPEPKQEEEDLPTPADDAP